MSGDRDVERMLKAMIKALENKHLNPGPLGPFLTTNWEKNHINKVKYGIIGCAPPVVLL